MTHLIDFYFDFSSPYAYLASERIESIARQNQRDIVWHPFLLGAAFKVSGQKPLVDVPLMRNYTINDLNRCAREHKIPFSLPDPFPVSTVNAARSILWLQDTFPDKVAAMIHGIFRAYFVDGKDISNMDNLLAIGESLNIEADLLTHAVQNSDIKERLKDAVNQAIEAGIFGSPCIVIDGEQFWGNDRIEQVSKWLKTGGW